VKGHFYVNGSVPCGFRRFEGSPAWWRQAPTTLYSVVRLDRDHDAAMRIGGEGSGVVGPFFFSA